MSRGALIQAIVGFTTVGLVLANVPPVHASQDGVRWDSDGMATVSAPPFTFNLELSDFTSPADITKRQIVDVAVSAEVDVDACQAPVKFTPTLDGQPIGPSEYLDAVDSYGDYVSVRVPVAAAGTYGVQIEASVETGSPYCSLGATTTNPYSASIDLFTLPAPLPGPASTRAVSITSSGVHTLAANTWSRSRPIRITFTIKDPERRGDLLHSICMQDTSDCWFEDAQLKPQSYIHRTASGWVRTWDFWWERASPSECVSYYWDQPDVSVILIVSNRDGRVLGRKKHSVKLTCRL